MIEPKPTSDLVQVLQLVIPFLTLCVSTWVVFKQSKQDAKIDGHMTAMLAQKDEITKVTAEAARALGNREGAQEKKAEIRADAQEATVGVAAADKTKVAPVS